MKYNVLTWMVLTANWLNYVVASEGYGIRGVDEITDWKKSTFERKVNNELMGDGSHDRINDYIITNLRGSAIAKSDVTKLEDEVKITDWNESFELEVENSITSGNEIENLNRTRTQAKIALYGNDYEVSSSKWHDHNDNKFSCTLGTGSVFDEKIKAFHFDYSQSSLITCPYDISQSKHKELTIEVIFKLDEDFNADVTSGWIVGQDNGGYDRSLILSDNRYGGMGQGIGSTYTSGISTPSAGVWHHAISTYRQGVVAGSFITLDGQVGAKTTARNGDGMPSFTIGGLQNYANHGIKGYIKDVRIYEEAFDNAAAANAFDEVKEYLAKLNAPSHAEIALYGNDYSRY